MSTRQVDGAFLASYETRWGDGWVYVRDGRLIGVDLPGEGPVKDARTAEVDAGGAAGGRDAGNAPSAAGGRDAANAPSAAGAPGAAGAADAEALAFWACELTGYFAGARTTWTAAEVPLAHLALGTFEQAVYEALLSIPPGETVSYGELAEMAGYPRAARAVGNAMAGNPIPIVVPCHRVIRSDGTMGRYGNDPRWKERLLLHEGWARAGGPPAEGS